MWLSAVAYFLCAAHVLGEVSKKQSFLLTSAGGQRNIREWSGSPPSDWQAKADVYWKTNETGWLYFDLVTNPGIDDEYQVYEGGYLEGYITQQYIFNHWYNVYRSLCDKIPKTCEKIDNYFQANLKWIKQMLMENKKTDPWWHHVNLYYRQMEGLVAGYTDAAPPNQTLYWEDIFMMNMIYDLDTLLDALAHPSERSKIFVMGHCSALIKLLPNNEDILVSHNSWTSYEMMLRAMKRYNFTLHTVPISKFKAPGNIITFSSYPGILISGDDYNIISSGLVTLETTNDVYNKSLYQYLSPETVMEAVRSSVANRLANSGKEWVKYFERSNSGTYNNQWMIVDYKKFQQGSPPKDGFLWIAEQIPGKVQSADVTNVLRQNTYWPSYNIPYFNDIYSITGHPQKKAKFGDWYSYEKSPRALIFQRDHHTVVDVESLLVLMRSNNYKNDPYSKCDCTPTQNACNAIAARCELNPVNGTYPIRNLGHRMHGAIDAKVTNSTMAAKLQMLAVSGPTQGTELSIFQWSKLASKDIGSHLGQPDFWNFIPSIFEWSLN